MRVSTLLVAAAGLGVAAALSPAPRLLTAGPPARQSAPAITVYRSPTCGCCKAWENHLTANGFTVKDVQQEDLSEIKAESGVPPRLVSCHTALVGGYVIEGHVPAADIQRLLREKPKVVGLTAPGMPGGAPGMDTSHDPYEVLTFDAKGNTTVWAKH